MVFIQFNWATHVPLHFDNLMILKSQPRIQIFERKNVRGYVLNRSQERERERERERHTHTDTGRQRDRQTNRE